VELGARCRRPRVALAGARLNHQQAVWRRWSRWTCTQPRARDSPAARPTRAPDRSSRAGLPPAFIRESDLSGFSRLSLACYLVIERHPIRIVIFRLLGASTLASYLRHPNEGTGNIRIG